MYVCIYIHTHTYIYTYVCVCVCVSVLSLSLPPSLSHINLLPKAKSVSVGKADRTVVEDTRALHSFVKDPGFKIVCRYNHICMVAPVHVYVSDRVVQCVHHLCHKSYEEEDTCHTAYEEEDTWHTSYEEEDTCVHHLDRTCPLAHSIPLDIERARRRHFQRLRAKLRAEARTRENRYTVAKQRREKLLEAALLI